MEMPQHLSTFRLQRYNTARREIIPGLRDWLLQRAFAGVDSDAPSVVCCLPTAEQEEHLNIVFSLIYEGPAKVVLSRLCGRQSISNASSFYFVPVELYEPSTVDGIPLKLGKGIYIDRWATFWGKAAVLTITPTNVIVEFDPPTVLSPVDKDSGSSREISRFG